MFFYSKPQHSKFNKYNRIIGTTSQKRVADMLDMTQSNIAQHVSKMLKMYSFTEITEKEYNSLQHQNTLGEKYVRLMKVNNGVGYIYMALNGSKLVTNLFEFSFMYIGEDGKLHRTERNGKKNDRLIHVHDDFKFDSEVFVEDNDNIFTLGNKAVLGNKTNERVGCNKRRVFQIKAFRLMESIEYIGFKQICNVVEEMIETKSLRRFNKAKYFTVSNYIRHTWFSAKSIMDDDDDLSKAMTVFKDSCSKIKKHVIAKETKISSVINNDVEYQTPKEIFSSAV